MKLLFVHQNMPGQYRELISWLAASGKHQIYFLTQNRNIPQIQGVQPVLYAPHPVVGPSKFGLVKDWETAAASALGAATAAKRLETEHNLRPDIIIGHAGWGELLYLKDLWSDVPIIGLFEYYYKTSGGLVGFDPKDPPTQDAAYIIRSKNAVHCTTLDAVDLGHVPTRWQAERFPEFFHDKFYICHDGIRTDRLHPNPNASVRSQRLGQSLTKDDEVITFVSRNLERARGFHVLMEAIPKIQKQRPNARVIIVGGTGTSYGKESQHPGGLLGELRQHYGEQIDWDRTHFLGRVPYDVFCNIIQISSCHLYLSMPFVLSWSLLESMAMQATIVATDVAPTREAITHGENGLLVDFFDSDALVDQVVDVLVSPDKYAHLGVNARKHVVENYDFETVCLPQHIKQINSLVPEGVRLDYPDTSKG